MKIKKIHIYGFGKLVNVELNLHPQMQILYANNERGKSTLLTFIRAVFYGLGDKKQRDFATSRDRYKPWENARWGGYITFNQDGVEKRLERLFGERKSDDKIHLFNEHTGELLQSWSGSKNQPGESLLGASLEEFNATTYISQAPDERYFKDKDNLIFERLMAILGANSEQDFNAQKIKNNLQDATKKLAKSKNERSLYFLQEHLQKLKARLHDLDEQKKLLSRQEEEYTVLQKASQSRQQQAESLQQGLAKFWQWQNINSALNSNQQSLNKTLSLHQEYEQLQADLQALRTTEANMEDTLKITETLLNNLKTAIWQIEEKQQHLAHQETLLNAQLAAWQALGIAKNEQGLWPWEQAVLWLNSAENMKLEVETVELRLKLLHQQGDLRRQSREISQQITNLSAEYDQLATKLKEQQAAYDQLVALTANYQQNWHQAENKYAVEQARLEEKKLIRNRDFNQRLARYNRYLRFLQIAGSLLLGGGLIQLILAWVFWTSLPIASQVLLIFGLIFIAGGLATFIHRSIFPPAQPSAITEPDAEFNLQQLKLKLQEAEDVFNNYSERSSKQAKVWQELEIAWQNKQQVIIHMQEQLTRVNSEAEELAVQIAHLENDLAKVLTVENLQVEVQNILSKQAQLRKQAQDLVGEYNLDVNQIEEWQKNSLAQINRLDFQTQALAREKSDLTNLRNSQRSLLTKTKLALASNISALSSLGINDDVLKGLQQYAQLCSNYYQQLQDLNQRHKILATKISESCLGLLDTRSQDTPENLNLATGLELLQYRLEAKHSELQVENQDLLKQINNLVVSGEVVGANAYWQNGDYQQLLSDLQDESERVNTQVQDLQEQLLSVSTNISSYRQQLASYESLRAEVKSTEIEYRDKYQYLNRLEQAQKWLDLAVERFESEFSPKMNAAANKYLQILTRNRYDSLHIARNFNVKIDAEADLLMKPGEVFSAGTYDQAFLAQRLALIGFLDSASSLPLLADDPFVNYDQERMVAAYKLFADIARQDGRQILLVTCHPSPAGFFPEAEGCTWQVWLNE